MITPTPSQRDPREPARSPRVSEVSIDTTAELRWFFEGPLPPEVESWFTRAGTRGLSESRRDTYRHDLFTDIGVKRRFGATLELKERLAAPELVDVGGITGQVETWQRWSPADHRVVLSDHSIWVDVDKAIVKRRFEPGGREVALTEATRAMSGHGCDAEIVALTVLGRQAWSLAFAAFGPADVRRRCLLETWSEAIFNQPKPPAIDFDRAQPVGYPEWLAGLRRQAASASLRATSSVTGGPP